MISRLTATAAAFALIASAALAFALNAQAQQPRVNPAVQARVVRIIELPRVVITARRLDSSPR